MENIVTSSTSAFDYADVDKLVKMPKTMRKFRKPEPAILTSRRFLFWMDGNGQVVTIVEPT